MKAIMALATRYTYLRVPLLGFALHIKPWGGVV
jgi:hypothetical protein